MKKKISIFRVNNKYLLKNLGFLYWHTIGVVLWLQALIFLGGLAIALIDDKPVGETLYLAFITALTIGYGDITPQSGVTKVIAIGIGFVGIIFTGVVVAVSLRALEMTIDQQKKEWKEKEEENGKKREGSSS